MRAWLFVWWWRCGGGGVLRDSEDHGSSILPWRSYAPNSEGEGTDLSLSQKNQTPLRMALCNVKTPERGTLFLSMPKMCIPTLSPRLMGHSIVYAILVRVHWQANNLLPGFTTHCSTHPASTSPTPLHRKRIGAHRQVGITHPLSRTSYKVPT